MGDGKPTKSPNSGCNETKGQWIFSSEQRRESPTNASATKAGGAALPSRSGTGRAAATPPGLRVVDDPDLSDDRTCAGGDAWAEGAKLSRSAPGNPAADVDARTRPRNIARRNQPRLRVHAGHDRSLA